ncbi:fatty acyl-AMP ligase [Streptomyces sp. 1331.2]|uniref:fatty acyl-AMP ligase n=1 Tax=Streptomyces sp. 1331.2 TaxID=1938835 RepID=UPI000BC5AE05|nr:fatty acyl-AMP ligase [Streptomyces sp. 1331.2]SOB81291.1 Acyl-CoA synthetase (AMP-forming)/AMP-acid ligase II [Streptomyces sp. 1331.2]
MAEIVTAPSVTAVLVRHAENIPEKDALTFVTDPLRADGASRLTYAELDRQARGIARRLHTAGIGAGDRAVLLYPAGPAFLTAFLGCLYAGAVAVPSSLPGRYRHERRRVVRIAADAGAVAVLTDTATRGDVETWTTEEGLDHLPVLVTDDGTGPGPQGWTMPLTTHDTVAVLQYTSGSTGDPKGVVITHGNLLQNSSTLIDRLGLDEHTPLGGWIPHFHDMGLMGIILPPLMSGAGTVLMSPATFLKRPHLWLHMIDRFGIHTSAAPDFAYELCTRRITDEQAEGLDLSRWKHAVDGSEPVRAAVLDRFRQRFAPYGLHAATLSPCYGMAEATLFVSGALDGPPTALDIDPELLEQHEFRPVAGDRPGRAVVSCGPVTGAEIRIVDPRTHRVLPDGGVGEIWLRGPVIGHGYWNREATNEAEFRATTADGDTGYLRTGDLGTLYEGELYVTGRLKDVLNLRGRNLYPQDIEHELRLQQPELGSLVGACFAVPGDGPQPEDVLVVTHEVRGIKEEERLRRLAADMRLTVAREFGAPVGAVLLLRPGGVRRTTSGKIQRSAMRELFRSGALDPTYADYQEGLLRPAAPAAGVPAGTDVPTATGAPTATGTVGA